MSRRELILCEFNVENLFVSMEYYEGQDLEEISENEWREVALPQFRRRQKPIAKLWGLSKAILDIDPDILMLVEVGGRESLENFNHHFLGDRYIPYFIDGNSRRAIDLAFLVKKGFEYRVEPVSNRETPIEVNAFHSRYTAKFSRDVAELRLYDDRGIRLIVLLAHLKSRISNEQDYQGKDVRTAEAIALAGIYSKRRTDFPEIPVVVGGDFNADISSLDLELIRRTDLTDFHDLLETPFESRISLVHFDYAGIPRPQVLDYLLVSPELKDKVLKSKSFTYRYKSFYDLPEVTPRSFHERQQMPSDHYPLILTIDLT